MELAHQYDDVPPPEQAMTQAVSAGAGVRHERTLPTGRGAGGERRISRRIGCRQGLRRAIPQAERGQGQGLARKIILPSAPPKPQTLLDRAVRAVETRHFISARIKQQGELFGHQITGEGRYYELRQGPIPRIHLELTVEVGSVSTSLVQVCNGATFWTYRKLPNGESLSKLDAVRAITALEQAAGKLPREAVACSPGLGGLGRLMRGLNAQFEFTSVVADQLGGLPVWKLSGGWKPAANWRQTSAEPERGDRKGPAAGLDPPGQPLARQRDAILGPGRLFSLPHRLPPQRARRRRRDA